MTEPRDLRAHLSGQNSLADGMANGQGSLGGDLWQQWQGFDPDIAAPHSVTVQIRPLHRATGRAPLARTAAPRPAAASQAPAGLITGLITAPVSGVVPGPAMGAAVTSFVSNAGAVAMNVPNAAKIYGATGSGVKIGILSNSFNALGGAAAEEANGDLPAVVTVLQDFTAAGTDDEGRAMAELVHAVAPSAQIYFATAESTEQAFASNILALAAAGCRVIVDDVTYFSEPFFQTGDVVQAAIETVIAEGVSYFTSASNEGINFYQAGISLVSAALPGHRIASQLENFGATAAAASGSDTLQQVTIGGGDSVTFDLQWTQPFQSIGGTGTAYSLAIYLYQNGVLVGSGTANVTNGDPVQTLSYTNTGATGAFDIAIGLNGGTLAAGGTLKYIIYAGNTTFATINDSAAGKGSGTVTGHELLANVNTVGAIAAGTTSGAEAFSSVGPGTIYYDANGAALATPQSTGKVDFLAPDGIATSVTGFAQFYGTSAAAPDAAAVATLLLQVNPNLTPAELSADLAATATAIPGAATQVGAGLVNANAALGAAYGSTWTVAAGGLWSTAAGWAAGALPGSTAPVTLDDDLGSLTANYTVNVTIPNAVAQTLTVGNDSTAFVTLDVIAGGSLSVGGGVTVGSHGRLIDGGTLGVTGGLTLAAGALLTLSGASAVPGGFAAPISVQGPATIDLASLAFNSLYQASYAAGTLTVSLPGASGSTIEAMLSFASGPSYSFALGADATGGESLSVACYRAGTRIATPLGEVPIERLAVGDTVLTAGGGARTLRWIGQSRHGAAAVAANRAVQPIRIAAASLDGRLPHRDLWVSPEHALLLPGVDGEPCLVPAHLLVDGRSVTRESAAVPIEYRHLELAGHDAVLAEGQPAETFVDDASRALFDNAASYRAPDLAEIGPAELAVFCAPRIGAGADLARLRGGIAARAGLGCGRLAGSVDSAEHRHVTGWAHEPDNPAAPVLLEILAGGESLGFALADRFRADLAAAGIGDGHHGFAFILPVPLAADRRHVLTIRRAADAATLPDGVVLIDRAPELAPLMVAMAASHPAELAACIALQIDRLQGRASANNGA